ncbi:MAG: hypothetical protein H0V70_30185 [Ktedonobacteraceae bacterium]|nr:hypothetical protein [Ktedonobacteraceae bacterium]
MTTVSKTEPSPNASVPEETFKVLIGWTNEQWSIQARSSLISATPEQHLQAVSAAQTHVTSRPAFTSVNPISEIDENQLVRIIKERPEYAYIEKEMARTGGNCRIALVNLKEVLAFQPLVRVDHFEAWQPESLNNERLYELCFPPHRDVSDDEITIDRDESGFTISTLDPNIRVLPWHFVPDTAPRIDSQLQYNSASSPLKMQLLSFSLLRVPNDLTVVHYQDRYIFTERLYASSRFPLQRP